MVTIELASFEDVRQARVAQPEERFVSGQFRRELVGRHAADKELMVTAEVKPVRRDEVKDALFFRPGHFFGGLEQNRRE